jgi:hypothetical protein
MNPKTPLNGFTLIDSAERSQTHPDSWAHPDEKTLERIEPGYVVKIGLTHPDLSGERFWGLVKERTVTGLLVQVDQDMLYTSQHGISDRDILWVEEQNVFGIVNGVGVTVWEAR